MKLSASKRWTAAEPRGFMAVVHRELVRIFSRRIYLLMVLVLPLVSFAVLAAIFGTGTPRHLPIAVYDADNTDFSRRLVRLLDAAPTLHVAHRVTDLKQGKTLILSGGSYALVVLPKGLERDRFRDQGAQVTSQLEAEQLFFARKVHGILIIPNNFERTILRKEQSSVAVYSDASYFLLYQQIMTGVAVATGTLSAGIEIKRMQAEGFSEAQAKQLRDPLQLVAVALFNPSGGYASYVVPAVLVMILQQTLLIGIGMLGGTAREDRERDAIQHPPLDHLSPQGEETGYGTVIAHVFGKSAAYFSIYLFNAAYYFIVLPRLYNFPQRINPLDLALLVLPFLLAVIFLGLTLATLFRHREASMLALMFTSLPALFLAGFSWPKESIPVWLRGVSYLLPSTTGTDGLLRINQMGALLQDVRFDVLVLWGLVSLYFLMACISMKRIYK
jgi:ABC-2 type transport system permease protein